MRARATGPGSARARGVVALFMGGLLAVTTACSTAPKLTAAPAGTPTTSMAALVNPEGYIESEYFISGRANTYTESGPWTIEGRFGTKASWTTQPFTSRMLVARPSDPAKFNGTVWVEWLNVTGFMDISTSLPMARRHILASGGAWVGVSAQKVGVDRLKDDTRYRSLNLPTDALSYEVFTQAAQLVRKNPKILGGSAHRVIGVGHSQSAVRLATYINAFQPMKKAYDGFVVHSRFSSAAPLGDGIMGNVPTRIRDDIGVPVLQLQSEVEVGLNLEAVMKGLGTWESVRQPNAGNVHTWEVAGGGHMDVTMLSALAGGVDADSFGSVLSLIGCTSPLNRFPMSYAVDAAYAATERWVRSGVRPPAAPPITTVAGAIQRDADGNALGGLRLPDIDVPVARHNQAASGNPICDLMGATTPFTPEALRAKYGTPEQYVAAYRAKADEAVAAQIMLPSDAEAGIAAAAKVIF